MAVTRLVKADADGDAVDYSGRKLATKQSVTDLGTTVAGKADTSALALKANAASPAFTGTPTGITKAHVGLGSVDNTADINKPASGPQQVAFDARYIAFVVVKTSGSTETRPSGAGVVFWIGGTVKPVNIGNDDVWLSAAAAAQSDSTAPSVPTGVTASSITESGFNLSWTASTDTIGVTGYEVLVDGTSKATPATASTAIAGLAAGTAYSVQVRARDAAGNWSALSTAITVTTTASSGGSSMRQPVATSQPDFPTATNAVTVNEARTTL